jgi:hypothetical protein
LIWTNADTTCPFALVIVHGCPGDFHPGGVEEVGDNHLLVLSGPYGDVVPGLNMLPLCVAPPNRLDRFPMICSTVTRIGVQLTFGFQEVNPPVALSGIGAGETTPE